jgi:hypothetical protein
LFEISRALDWNNNNFASQLYKKPTTSESKLSSSQLDFLSRTATAEKSPQQKPFKKLLKARKKQARNAPKHNSDMKTLNCLQISIATWRENGDDGSYVEAK